MVQPNLSRKRKNTSGQSSIPSGIPVTSIEGSVVLKHELTMSKLLDQINDELNGTLVKGAVISEFGAARKCLQAINECCIVAKTSGEKGAVHARHIESKLHELRRIVKEINMCVYDNLDSENGSLDLIVKLNQEINNLEAMCMKANAPPQSEPHLRSRLQSSPEAGHLAQDNANVNTALQAEPHLRIKSPCNPEAGQLAQDNADVNIAPQAESHLRSKSPSSPEAGQLAQDNTNVNIAPNFDNTASFPNWCLPRGNSSISEANCEDIEIPSQYTLDSVMEFLAEETGGRQSMNSETLTGLDVNATGIPPLAAGEAGSETLVAGLPPPAAGKATSAAAEATGMEDEGDAAAAKHLPATNEAAAGSNTSDQAQ